MIKRIKLEYSFAKDGWFYNPMAKVHVPLETKPYCLKPFFRPKSLYICGIMALKINFWFYFAKLVFAANRWVMGRNETR